MKAGIIAAGEGSRLRSEGIAVAKPLVPVNGVPLIERLITSFIRNGITEVACIVNEYSLEVRRFVEEQHFPIPITFVVKTTPSSMHSLFALASHLRDEQFLLSTVDSIYHESEFSQFLHHAQAENRGDGVLAVTQFVDDENPLYVKVDDAMRIVALGKSADFHNASSRNDSAHEDDHLKWVTGGLYIFSPKIFQEMEVAMAKGMERLRNFLQHLVANGYRLEAFPFSKIVDVDHVGDLATAEEFLRQSGIQSSIAKSR